MGAVVELRPTGRGRQPAVVEELRDVQDELTALVAEGQDVARLTLAMARAAQVALAKGHSPANILDDLERLALRQLNRMAAAGAFREVRESCVDERAPGHGRAA